MLERIAAAVAMARLGDPVRARSQLEGLWDDSAADPLARCAIAHALADLQSDPTQELWWDERALAAATAVSDEAARSIGLGGAGALEPSLQLNLADVCRRLGETERAARHVALGRAALVRLAPDGYLDTIAAALDRIDAVLAAG